MVIKFGYQGLIAFVFATFSLFAFAQDAKESQVPSPSEVVTKFTDNLLVAVKNEGASIKEDPKPYFKKVEEVMEEAIHFRFIAKGVMGDFAKTATKEEKQQFLAVFKEKLAETLAKAIVSYSASEINIEKEIADEKNPRKAYVSQIIAGSEGEIRVVYTLGNFKKSGWRVSNMTLDSANLGETYKNQFAQSVKINDGSISKAIEWWITNG